MLRTRKNQVIAAGVVLAMLAGLLLIVFIPTAGAENNSGIPGLEGPSFTFGIVTGASGGGTTPGGAAGAVYNCAPYALTGYVQSKNVGSIHLWVSACSQVVLDLGIKPGDIVTILCSETQVENVNTGDWVQIVGFTVRGRLIRAEDIVLPAPFSY